MFKIKNLLIIFALLALILCIIPCGFASENQTHTDIQSAVDNHVGNDKLTTSECYFDCNNDREGNGSADNPYKTFANHVSDNSINYIASGNYDGSNIGSHRNVEYIGSGALNTIIDGKGLSISTLNILTFKNITLNNFKINNNGKLNGENVIFTNSNSGVITSYNNVSLNNCTFINNYNDKGGAIFTSNGHLNIVDCEFINNTANLWGGAISAESTTIIISNTKFKNSKSKSDAGGAIFLKNADLSANNLNIFNSSATFGGAICSINSILNLTSFVGDYNRAKYQGGSVYKMYGKLYIIKSNLTNNFADNGAGLFIDQVGYQLVKNNKFINNTALSHAGGFYSLFNSNSTIENNEYSNNHAQYSPDSLITNEINLFIGNGNYTMYVYNPSNLTVFPSKYDSREYGYVTPVKSQGSNGNCWAFATMATLESCILKAGGPALDLSEANLKNLFGKYSDYGWNLETNTGGYANMGYNYLISWLGPVLESDDPYIINGILSPLLNSLVHVQNVVFFQRKNFTDNDEVKKAIMDYGAVYSPIYSSFRGDKQYYTGGTSANHAIVIVGWDDDLQFDGAPANGGWIIKNSWGSNSGDHGYYYVSYYDTSCVPIGKSDSVFTFVLNDTVKFDKNYQYDIQGKSDFFLNSSSIVWYKNKFTATDDEYIAAVSTIFEKETNYEFSIYVNNQFKLKQSGFTSPGYYTFDLNSYIPLKAGDIFEVVFKINVSGDAGVPISEKISFMKGLYKAGTSFISYDGENWVDFFNLEWKYSSHTYDSQVACIKAFTVFDKLNTSINLLANIIDNNLVVDAKIYNQYGYLVHGGNVLFRVGGDEYNVIVKNGIAKLSLPINKNNFEISAEYTNEGFNSSTAQTTFDLPFSTNLTLIYDTNLNPVNFTALVINQYGYEVSVGNVTFTIQNKNYTVNIKDGKASILHQFNLTGPQTIYAFYNVNNEYVASKNNVSLDISKTDVDMTLVINKNVNNVEITVNFSRKINEVVYLSLNNDISNKTSVNGSCVFTFDNLNIGDYAVKAYLNSFLYDSNNVTDQFKVYNYNTQLNASDVTLYYLKNNQFAIYLTDGDNNPLLDKEVQFKINNLSYKNKTDSNGRALIYFDLNNGVYRVDTSFAGDDDYLSISKNSTITILTTIVSQDATKTYNSIYSFNILDGDGKSSINKELTVRVNDKEIKLVSFNGYVSLPIDFASGNYKITITNPVTGEVKTQNINVVNRIYQNSNVVMYYGADLPYSVCVLDDDGNPLANADVLFTIGSKVYTEKTDANGKANLKIRLKPNTYTVTAEFKGFKVENKYTVKTTIITKNIKVKKGKTIKFNAQFFKSNGQLLKKSMVKFKFMKKTYKVKTNKKGKAVLKIKNKFKSGKYPIYTKSGSLKVKNIIKIK